MATPSQVLAERVVKRLVEEGLLTAEAGEKLRPRLAEGKLRPEDWRLPIELGLAKEAKR